MAHIELIDPKRIWDDDFPLSPGVKAGSMLFVSGQIALDSDGNVVGKDDLVAQTRKCFENMKEVVEAAGAKLTDIVKLTTFFTVDITDPSVVSTYFDVRREFLGKHKPASSGVQVKSLMYPSLLLEMDAIAVLPSA